MTIRTRPYAYQKEGVRLIHHKFNGRALLGDDMGLGKSLQAIMYKDRYVQGGPTIIVCPPGLKWQWQAQLSEHAGLRSEVLEGMKPPIHTPMNYRPAGTFIIGFDCLGDPKKEGTWLRFLKKMKPKLIIGDEIHMIQNRNTIRSRAVVNLCKGVKKIILMSGTPATSFPAQLFPAIHILDPETFPSFRSFAFEFCDPKKNHWGWTFNGCVKPKKLNRLLRANVLIRRQKKDVLKDLPAKVQSVIPVDIKRRKEYVLAEKDLISWLIKNNMKRQAFSAMSAERLVRFGYLKRLASELKMDEVISWIREFLTSGKKLIIFGIHKARLKELREAFPGISVIVDGSVTGHKRQLAVDAFNKDKKIRLFLGNVDAAGVGWSCTSASDVMFFELPWTPGKVVQASDRIHGIGRGIAGRQAFVHFLVAHGTIEELLVKILHNKAKNLTRIFDGKDSVKDMNVLDLMDKAILGRK